MSQPKPAGGPGGPMNSPLGTAPIRKLLFQFALPCCITMVIGSVYNVVDQLFIGRAVGILGNSATNIAHPLTICCAALALLFGMGGASFFNLSMGRKETEKCPWIIGSTIVGMLLSGVLLCLILQLFLTPILTALGSTQEVLPYAAAYVRVSAFGIPFLILTTGGGYLIRADGSPKMTMVCAVSGAVINTVLDALFVMVFRWGMTGAALATILGQIFSGGLVLWYLICRFKTVPLAPRHYVPKLWVYQSTLPIGIGMSFNQLAMLVMQVLLNNSLRYYGGLSVYGSEVALAAAGIATKVNALSMSIIVGIAQGSQPILSFNYGARQLQRVKKTFALTAGVAAVPAVLSFVAYQLFSRQLIGLFGSGGETYLQCGALFLRVYLCMICVNFMQPVGGVLFTSMGKAKKSAFLSLTRQIIFLLPMLVIFPLLWGFSGILYAAPLADLLAFSVAVFMVCKEFAGWKKLPASPLA